MANAISVNTGKYKQDKSIKIDGHVWKIVAPGAKTELMISQSSRLAKLYALKIDTIDKKIEAGTYTDNDVVEYEKACDDLSKHEKEIMSVFEKTFKDNTPDNSEVKAWIDETPTAIISSVFEEFKKTNDETMTKDNGEQAAATS